MSEIKVQQLNGNSPNFRVTVDKNTTLDVESEVRVNNQQQLPVPTGDTASRNKSPVEGSIRYNSETGLIEIYHKPIEGTGQWCDVNSNVGGPAAPTESAYSTEFTFNGTSYDFSTTSVVDITTSGKYDLVVPDGGNLAVEIELWGGGGGGANYSNPGRGAAGGYAQGKVVLEPGTYTVIVGDGGEGGGYNSVPDPSAGGYPDGGASQAPYNGYSTAGGGGGSSRFGPNIAAPAINNSSTEYYLIAGGGGGGYDYGYPSYGDRRRNAGEGGGKIGADGGQYYPSDGGSSPGGGGGQLSGGTAGTGGRQPNGDAGGKYQGGRGSGGGGGGGYYGGGGAAGYYAQGGGGSGYADEEFLDDYALVGGGTLNDTQDGTGTETQLQSRYHKAYKPYGTTLPSSTTGRGGDINGGRNGSKGGTGALRLKQWVEGPTATEVVATGGDRVITKDGYRYHVFTTPGQNTWNQFVVTEPGYERATLPVEYIIVAGGGGGGGGDVGSGGGAGGFRTNVEGFKSGRLSNPEGAMSLSAGTYNVNIGDGGAGSISSPSDGSDGGSSDFNGISSTGGGGGASWGSGSGRSGGSGGGGVSSSSGGSGTTGQGFDGGNGRAGPYYPQGGGGGASSNGESSPGQPQAGYGGSGLPNPFGYATKVGYFFQGAYYLAGGGGGGVESTANPGNGGRGGGGMGGRQTPNIFPGDGAAGTGGGGGGEDSQRGGHGGTGLVIIRYKLTE